MQSLLKNFWKQSRFRAKSQAVDQLANQPLLGDEAAQDSCGASILIRLTPNVLVERKCAVTIVLAMCMYASAAFLANEWLYLLACGLIVVVAIGAIFPVLAVKSLKASCLLPQSAVANERSEIVVSISRHDWCESMSWLLPVDCLRTRILLARRGPKGYVVENALSKQPVLIENMHGTATLKLQVPLLERGVYKLSAIEVSSPFPFGLVWATREIKPQSAMEESIVVYPRGVNLNGAFLTQLKGQISSMGLSFTESLALTQSTSVRSIREFRIGDSLRHIHWASSARTGKLLVREFDSETLPVFDIYLDLGANWRSRAQFELAICLATSLISFGYDHDMLPELHLSPSLDAPQMAALMCDLPTATTPLEMLLEILARVEPLPYRSTEAKTTGSDGREQLAIMPSPDVVIRSGQAGASAMSMPVELVTMSGHSKASSATHSVIATIYGEQDLQAL